MSAESIDRILTNYRKGMEDVHQSEMVEWYAFGYWAGRLENEDRFMSGNQFATHVKSWWNRQDDRSISHVGANLKALYNEWKAKQ